MDQNGGNVNLPTTTTINGQEEAGVPLKAALATEFAPWARSHVTAYIPKHLAPPPDASPSDWRHPDVGWGIILPENEGIDPTTRASAADAPEPIRRLLEERPWAPIYRYRPKEPFRLFRYFADRPADKPLIGRAPRGLAVGHIPRYLLICGTPVQIPWDLQYYLNTGHAVGRLDLDDEGLENYIRCLMSGWDESGQGGQSVLWAVQKDDRITDLMRRAIAEPVAQSLASDPDFASRMRYIDGSSDIASTDALVSALIATSPAFVLSTSHGLIGPTNRPEILSSTLGSPLDQSDRPLTARQLLTKWQPNGAIWYAHACCSAGVDGASRFGGLFPPGEPVAQTLDRVANIGARVAPLPKALLGASKPLRAFIGHVEPTFDLTLSDPETGELLMTSTRRALYNKLFAGLPVGLSLAECYRDAVQLLAQAAAANARRGLKKLALVSLLAGLDLQNTVILGDPTVTLALRSSGSPRKEE
jgi:hypothetical protein